MANKEYKPVSPKPISAKDWSLINADVSLANVAMDNEKNLHMIGMAAYHYTQAIEKSLKAIIRANNPEFKKSLATHDFAFLLVETELCCAGFIDKHQFIADNSQELSVMNGVRYGNKTVRKGDVYVLMKEARELFNDLEQDLLRSTGLSKEQLQKQANNLHKNEDIFISLDDSHSKYESKARDKQDRNKKPNRNDFSRD